MPKERAKYGAEAWAGLTGELPNPFPRTMGPNCLKYVREVVESGLTSDMIGRFERAFADEMGVKHCIAAPGCTPALAILAAAFDFEPGDEIIVSPITDYGTVQGLIRENYIPVFADAEPGTVNLSARTIEPLITSRTRAILVVHMTGLICDMDPINDLAAKHGLIVYEDACQAVFGEYKGRLAGTLSTAAAFSFDGENVNVYSCWMFGISLDPVAFRCDADEFARQLEGAGIPGAGTGKYYLMPAALTFLDEWARGKRYPYSIPPASRDYRYGTETCPTAWEFLQGFIRWSTFCEKYQPEHCALAARLVRTVADRNRA